MDPHDVDDYSNDELMARLTQRGVPDGLARQMVDDRESDRGKQAIAGVLSRAP